VAVSGAVTANAGTDLNTSLLALEAGGNLEDAAVSLGVMDGWDEAGRAKVSPIAGQAGVAAGAGAVGVTVPRVTLASDDPAVTSLSTLDDWDEADRAKVNPIVGQAGIAAGAGAVGVTVPRVTLASDDPAVASLSTLDDWDEADRAKVNPIVGQAGIAAGAGAVGATVPRVTLASDDPAVASLSTLDDWDEADRAKVNPIAGQAGVQGGSGVVTALTQRMVLATDVALPSGTNTIGAVFGAGKTVTATSQRPGDTTTYAAGDAWGIGFTLTDIARGVNGTIIIQDMVIGVDEAPALKLAGRIYVFDAAVTASTDNAALVISDADYAKMVGYVDFALGDTTVVSPLNSVYHARNLGIEATCTGDVDDLFCLVMVTNAYIPTASITLTVRAKSLPVN